MKVALGIPHVGDIPGESFLYHCRAAVEISRSAELVIIAPGDVYPHDKAREYIVSKAIKADVDLLMFVDVDVAMPAGFFSQLLEVMERRSARVVSGKYLQRGYPYVNIWGMGFEDGSAAHVDSTAEHEVEIMGCGMGAVLIDFRWVQECLSRPYFKIKWGKDLLGKTEWEDYGFCRDVLLAGGKIYGLPYVECKHLAGRKWIDSSNAQAERVCWLKNNPVVSDGDNNDKR